MLVMFTFTANRMTHDLCGVNRLFSIFCQGKCNVWKGKRKGEPNV